MKEELSEQDDGKEVRVGLYSPERLESLAESLCSTAKEIRALAKSLREAPVPAVKITGHSGLETAFEKLNTFIAYATGAILKEKRPRQNWDEPS